jgi:hypothetical protein
MAGGADRLPTFAAMPKRMPQRLDGDVGYDLGRAESNLRAHAGFGLRCEAEYEGCAGPSGGLNPELSAENLGETARHGEPKTATNA